MRCICTFGLLLAGYLWCWYGAGKCVYRIELDLSWGCLAVRLWPKIEMLTSSLNAIQLMQDVFDDWLIRRRCMHVWESSEKYNPPRTTCSHSGELHKNRCWFDGWWEYQITLNVHIAKSRRLIILSGLLSNILTFTKVTTLYSMNIIVEPLSLFSRTKPIKLLVKQ